MWSFFSWFLIVLGFIALIAIFILGLAVYSYRRLVITVKSFSSSPDFKLKPTSVIGSLVNVITGNYVAAVAGFVNGVNLHGEIACINHSFVPLYLPGIEHKVSIGGRSCLNAFHTNAKWLWPGASNTIPIDMTISTNDIPQVALAGITHGGVIGIEMQSTVTLGHFSYLKITSITTKITDYFSKAPKGKIPLK
jgi:hypothetical protein